MGCGERWGRFVGRHSRLQDRLGENLPEYIRHFLMRVGKIVRQRSARVS
jgi:hypothetical protein